MSEVENSDDVQKLLPVAKQLASDVSSSITFVETLLSRSPQGTRQSLSAVAFTFFFFFRGNSHFHKCFGSNWEARRVSFPKFSCRLSL